MILGLTGRNGSGKGTAADILKKFGFTYYSLSDVIRDALQKQGQGITRERLIAMGRKLREDGGSSVLAELTLQKIKENENAVVDSIRNPFEVRALKKRKDFYLLHVVAEQRVRFKRCKARDRENEAKDFSEFVRLENAELTSQNPAGQQLIETEKLADFFVENSGTVVDLEQKLRTILQNL